MIQIRDKSSASRLRLAWAREVVSVACAVGAVVIVNDRPDIAMLALADGVHLGEDDMPAEAAREVLGSEALIGVSTHSVEAAMEAMNNPTVNYVALGPIFPTATKPDAHASVGMPAIERVARRKSKPLVVIGGLFPEHVGECLARGADSVAMVAGLLDRGPATKHGDSGLGVVRANVERAFESMARAGIALAES